MIPKIIHYCWLSDDPMPRESVDYINSWRELLPDYEFILWNREKFDVNSVLWVKEAFLQKKYAFAADYIRLYAVYHYGGFYLDTDVELKKSFDDLLERDLVVGYEDKYNKGIEAGCFGAEKEHEFVEKCLSYYQNRRFTKDDGSLDTRTLPMIMAELISEKLKKNVFQCDFFTAKNQETGAIEVTQNTYAIHHFAGSWLTDYERSMIAMTSHVYNLLGKNFLGKIVLLLSIFFLRVKKFGIKKAAMYFYKQYIQNGAGGWHSIKNFLCRKKPL